MSNFVLPVDKPVGPTSHDVVARARRALGEKRVGHTGTLDPFASGLLLLCVGRATRLAEFLSGLDKTYIADVMLDAFTDTDDRTGQRITETDAWRLIDEARVREALAHFTGTISQVPPAYSAKKVQGERSYRAARRGEELELQPVQVTIHSLRLLHYAPPLVRVEVDCSSGTYIRALARDIGAFLGTGGYLLELRRTRVGEFGVERAVTLERLEDPDAVSAHAIRPLDALRHIPRVDVDAVTVDRLRHGQRVPIEQPVEEGTVAVASDNELIAIATMKDGVLHPRKVFSEA